MGGAQEHVAHLQRMANESWRGSPEHAALTAAIAVLSAPQPAACVGCEDKPSPENTPCAVCGQQPAAVEAEAVIERLRAEVEAVWAVMPRDSRYLDPPDGGDVPLHEQVRRMAADATRAERLEAEREVIVAEAMKYAGKSGRLEAKVDRLAEMLKRLAAFVRPTCPSLSDKAQAVLRDHGEDAE